MKYLYVPKYILHITSVLLAEIIYRKTIIWNNPVKWFVVENKCPLAGQTLKRLVVVLCTMCMLYVETGKYGGGGGEVRDKIQPYFL